MKTTHHVLLGAFLVAAPAAAAVAGTIVVPRDHPTIQSAIDAAGPGDTVIVTRGTYAENVVIDRRSRITLRFAGAEIAGGDPAPALEIRSSDGISVLGLSAPGGAADAVVVSDSFDTLLSRLFIEQNAERGIVVRRSDGTRISRCTIDGSGWHGIDVAGSDDVVVEHCRVLGAGGDGVVLGDPQDEAGDCDDGTVVRNIVVGAATDAIRVAGSNNRIERNSVVDPQSDGIVLEDGFDGSGNRLFRNRLRNAGNDGLRIGGSSNTVERNVLLGTGDIGISVAGSGGHRIARNVVKLSDEEGIEVQSGSDGCLVERNKIIRSGDDGIDLKHGNTRVIRNRIVRAEDDGIDVNEGAGSLIERNVVSRASDFGIQMDAGGNTVRLNRVGGSGEYDLTDRAGPGANAYERNRFGTVDPEADPFGGGSPGE